MAKYLSSEWFKEMQAAATVVGSVQNQGSEPAHRKLSIRQVISDSPFGEVSYTMRVEDGRVEFSDTDEGSTDVTFVQSYETAASLHKGELTTQEAMFAGKIRVSGRLNTLLDNSDLLYGMTESFAEVRSRTTY